MKTTRLNYKIILLGTGVLCLGILLVIHGEAAGEGVRSGLLLCGTVVIPALFPFMALSDFIVRSGSSRFLGKIFSPVMKLFRLPGVAGTAVLLSFVSGYPVGPRAANSLYREGQLSLEDARRMSYFCVNAGPAFVVTAVGAGMLHNSRAGVLLLVSHMGASLVMGIGLGLFSGRRKAAPVSVKQSEPAPKTALADAFVEATGDACGGILAICGFAILFSGIIGMLGHMGLPDLLYRGISGILEVTTGCAMFSAMGSLPALAAVISFGGCSVLFQILAGCKDLRLGFLPFFVSRAAHAGLSALLMLGLLSLFPISQPVFSNGTQPIPAATSASAAASLAVLGMCVLFLLFAAGKNKVAIGGKM